jgi:hypothetical protein
VAPWQLFASTRDGDQSFASKFREAGAGHHFLTSDGGGMVLGYLLWTGWAHLREGRSPTGTEFRLVVFAAVLPDLIDKPLAWTFGVLPSRRSFAHSL